jgi:hypothetical protein
MWLETHDAVVGPTWHLRTRAGLCIAIDTRTGRLTRA